MSPIEDLKIIVAALTELNGRANGNGTVQAEAMAQYLNPRIKAIEAALTKPEAPKEQEK